MLTEKKKEINGTTYTFQMMPASIAYDLFWDLTKILSPGLAPILANFKSLGDVFNQEIGDARSGFLGEAVINLAKEIDKEKFKTITMLLMKHTIIEGKGAISAGVFEAHFAGKIMDIVKVTAAALEAQYGDFLDALGSAVKAQPALAPKAEAKG